MADEVKARCLDVARAILRTPPSSGGKPVPDMIGDDLAEMLARELAARLAAVMPSALVRTIGDDLLEGADAIAEFVYGDTSSRRKVYHLAQQGYLPVFRIGSTICARKSTILAWIRRQEEEAMQGRP